jgi:hypothetical protein
MKKKQGQTTVLIKPGLFRMFFGAILISGE